MQESIRIAGIYDLAKFPWGRDIFEFTIEKLRAEYGYEDLTYDLADGKCDETSAVRGYWDLRTNNVPVHGIVGARCSGASVSLARIAGLEQVTQVSPASTSSRLSNKEEFPFFSRMVAPDDSRGEVGALVSTLRWFGWQRVTILSTDTLYAKDYVSQ
jgi:ABC-type branched-subunit amino acid transport system substrate-binding protein